ncbi:DUF4422 domain-containing protein [Lachnospiraceae bacterium 48-21]
MQSVYENFMDRVRKENSVKIYGAGKFAKTLCYLLERNKIGVEAFVVTDMVENPTEMLNHPVLAIDKLEPSELCNIVVGFEKNERTKNVVDFLLTRQVTNIIMVSPNIVNDIYCNFLIDEKSIDSFCEELLGKTKIIAYIADLEGEIILQYLCKRGVQISGACTDSTDLSISEDIPVVAYDNILDLDKDSFIILTMSNVYWQRSYITRLRKSGFENIILISDNILKAIKYDYRRIIWEKMEAGFHLIKTANIEKDFYLIQKEQGMCTYRWRIAAWDRELHKNSVLDSIKSGKMVEMYEKQFPGFSYLPYKEAPLCEIDAENLNIEVYMVKFHKDRNSEEVTLPEWVIPIQVGKSLTDIRIAEICDNVGENISLKNSDYSEGTALYWMWKNTSGQDYVGLFHYRRHIALGADSLKKLTKYDALLTVPSFISKNLKEFFCSNFILENDWNTMMRYIKEYDEAYYGTALKYEKEHCYFPCNIFIIRREYFDELCAFIFGVLEKVDSYYENLKMIRMDRYLGYLVENLLSIYMMHNAERLKVAYTDMKYYYPLEREI